MRSRTAALSLAAVGSVALLVVLQRTQARWRCLGLRRRQRREFSHFWQKQSRPLDTQYRRACRGARAVIRLLRELAKAAQGTSGHDSTVYGLSRASPKSFFPHHLAAISSAIVCADARSIRNHAASLATQLSHGMI